MVPKPRNNTTRAREPESGSLKRLEDSPMLLQLLAANRDQAACWGPTKERASYPNSTSCEGQRQPSVNNIDPTHHHESSDCLSDGMANSPIVPLSEFVARDCKVLQLVLHRVMHLAVLAHC